MLNKRGAPKRNFLLLEVSILVVMARSAKSPFNHVYQSCRDEILLTLDSILLLKKKDSVLLPIF